MLRRVSALRPRYDAPYRPGRSRRATLLHPLRMVPHVAAAVAVATGAWITVVVTGRMPRRLHHTIALGTSYHARSSAYLSLLTDVAPRVRERDPRTGATVPSGGGGV